MRIILFLLLICCSPAFSGNVNNKETVNILSWWGYLTDPEMIRGAEKQCGVRVSVDEYYSTDEFLRRWDNQKEYYDIIIFSSTIYNVIKNKIPHIAESTLSKQSLLYNAIIRSHYKMANYPNNIAYYALSLTGFLWNPINIAISENDTIKSIFSKALYKYVVIIDDPIEVNLLMKANNSRCPNNNLTISEFKNLTQGAYVYITNNFNQLYRTSDFAFSYGWSGEAVVDSMTSNKKYQFLIHPKLSYISYDLIAQTSHKKASLCISKYLSSKRIISRIENKDFYFSPYTDTTKIKNPVFKKIYEDFSRSLPKLRWIDAINSDNFRKINISWQLLKLTLTTQEKE